MPHDNTIYVHDKFMNKIAVFSGDVIPDSDEAKRNLMIAPTVHRETNGESILTFQMLANCEKWELIKDPENIYELNDHFYTALNDGAYEFTGDEGVRIVNVKLVETWYLLDKKFVQAYNCGIYCYAKATFEEYTTNGAKFTIKASDCSNPSNTISSDLAWRQVKNWTPTDEKGNSLTYGILTSKDYKPTGWDDAPAGVQISNVSSSGDSITITVKGRLKTQAQKIFTYSGNSYYLDVNPPPGGIESVYVNVTIASTEIGEQGQTYTKYSTSTKQVNFFNSVWSSASGFKVGFELDYTPAPEETINSVIANYGYYELGNISSGATCTFAYGPEVVDEHTFVILPKAKEKYKLTVNGVEYEDSQVRDSRGTIMPRGSGGYALWAALRDTGWELGVCDVIAKDFDASIDYGCFNVESDMKDVLYIVQYIQELYGGILDFDSKNKLVNYRAENDDDYESYKDGFNAWTGYEFREGKNMTDQPHITWDNELVTRGYLLGYGNLNVKDVNGGKTYVEDFSYTTDVYEGYLEQPLIYDTRDDGGKNQLLYWGKKELAKKCRPRVKITANVTDIRTVEGYEHEIFDLNNVVRCYYKNSETGEEAYEEKRITLWEYNAFAMWDCTVEIGDKTQNLVDVFKLIYNTAIDQAPSANASGQISSGNVSGLDDWLSESTTVTSKSIADLIITTNDLYAKVDLFAQYQKTTENMISETYAGLTLYADEKSSELALVIEGHYDELKRADETILTTLNDEIVRVQTDTAAGFQAQQTQNDAFANMFAELNQTITSLDGAILSQSQALANFQADVTDHYARTETLAQFQQTITDDVGRIVDNISLSGLVTKAGQHDAYAQLLSSFYSNGITNFTNLQNFVSEAGSTTMISATDYSGTSTVSVSGNGASINSSSGYYSSSYINVNGNGSLYLYGSYEITLYAAYSVKIQTGTFYFNNQPYRPISRTIGGESLTYLGLN